ncbi:MAG TPA: hypothetical protein VKX24_12195, partial [Acidimicrobiia bacterium]|nr:hypothetical protein [Acidimicrobiia bacterium]
YDQFFIGIVALVVVLWIPGGLADIGRRLWRRIEGRPPGPPLVSPLEEIDVRDGVEGAIAAAAAGLESEGAGA